MILQVIKGGYHLYVFNVPNQRAMQRLQFTFLNVIDKNDVKKEKSGSLEVLYA